MITDQQIAEIADEAHANRQLEVSAILYLLAACMAVDKEGELAAFTRPFAGILKTLIDQSIEIHQARNN